MKLTSTSFRRNGVIPGRCAFAVKHPTQRVSLAQNRNPQLAWSDVPEGTRSFALLCIDTEVPTRPDDVNQADREVPYDLPRGEFVHWLMVDIPAELREIAEGECSRGVSARGKSEPAGPAGSRQGVNDYTGWFAGDAQMAGTYLGYDGPCPPWNDSRVHRYRFELLATDFERCPVEGAFTLAQLRAALQGHVLTSAEVSGRYSLNPRYRLR
jgi:Raf kinase inhibitor-like YbhB/YbcL family protein